MSDDLKVSIVMPVYNGGSYFELALQSALAQTYRNIEIVIVNDGSTDRGATDAVARRYAERHPDTIRYFHQANTGVAGALNKAVGEMTGDIFCWLSHDDLYAPEKTAVQVDFWRRLGRPDAMLISNYTLIDPEGREFANVQFDHEQFKRAPMLPLFRGAVNGCTVFIPVDLLRTIPGPFDLSRRFTQDFQLWRQLIRQTDFFHVPQSLVHYRVHPGQDSQRPDIAEEGESLWRAMVDETTEIERVQMYGSSWRFYEETRKILAPTPYVDTVRHLEEQRDRSLTDTLVSVVMPFFNEIALARRALASILTQTYRHLDIVLVDDGSTEPVDDLLREAAADPRVRVLRTPNRGLWAARNLGIRSCRGDYVAFLDAEAEFRPEKVARQLEAMQVDGLQWSATAIKRLDHNEIGGFSDAAGADGVKSIKTSVEGTHTSTIMVGRSFISDSDELLFVGSKDITLEVVNQPGLKAAVLREALTQVITRAEADISSQGISTLLVSVLEQIAASSQDTRTLLTLSEIIEQKVVESLPFSPHPNNSFSSTVEVNESNGQDRTDSPGESIVLRTHEEPIRQNEARAAQLYERGYLDASLQVLEQNHLTDTYSGRLLGAHIKRAQGKYIESLEDLQLLDQLSPGDEVRKWLAVAFALTGFKDEARSVAQRYSTDVPGDRFFTLEMGSAFAAAGDFDEADAWFSRNVVIPLDNGLDLNTSICRFSNPLLGTVNPYRREDFNPSPRPENESGLGAPVLLLSGDARYHRLFLEAAVRSFELRSDIDLQVHVHVMDPDDDIWHLVDQLRRSSRYTIHCSSEYIKTNSLSDRMARSYYTIGRLIILPDIIKKYNAPIIVSDLDQIALGSMRALFDEISHCDAALLHFETNVTNIPSRFSASLFAVNPTEGGVRFAETARSYILGQLQECGGQIPWHLDQVALAYAQMSDRSLNWLALPQALLKIGSHPAGVFPAHPKPLFWPVVASVSANRSLMSSSSFSAAVRRTTDSDQPKVLIADIDMFSVVGGGQVLFRVLIKRNPGISFYYFSRGPDLELKEKGSLPVNAHPLRLATRDHVYPLLPQPTWDTAAEYGYIALEMASACIGWHFDCIDTPSYLPAAGYFRDVFQLFGVKADRMVTSLQGWISVGVKNQFNSADLESDRLQFETLEDESIRACDGFYTVSSAHKHEVIERIGDAGTVIDMHNVLNEPIWPENGIDLTGKPDLWFVGRLDRNKGPDIFIEIVSKIDARLYRRIVMAGPDLLLPDGETCWDKIRTQAVACGLDVEYVGELLPEQLQQVAYNGKNVIIIPSRSDTFNLVALEAITRFTPILLSTAAGASGFMRTHHPDIPILDMSPDDLGSAVLKLTEFLKAYPESGRSFHEAVRHCGWPRIQDNFMLDVYVDRAKKGQGAIREGADKSRFILLQPDPRSSQRAGTWETFDPQLTIIVPTYRRPQWLVNCLASIAQERPDRTRILVIDDGSPAEMRVPDIANAYAPFVRVITTENRGEANAVNLGIAEADTPFLMILSDDDVIEGDWPSRAIDHLLAEPDVALVYPDWAIINGAGEIVENHDLVECSVDRLLGDHWCLPGPGAIFRREDALAVGGRNGSVRYVSDYDFWLRLSSRGRFKHVPIRGAYWRDHGGNATLAKDRRLAEEHVEVIVRELSRRQRDGNEIDAALAARALATAHLCAGVILSRVPSDVSQHAHFILAYLLAPETVRTLPVNIAGYSYFYPQWLRDVLAVVGGGRLEGLSSDEIQNVGRILQSAIFRRIDAAGRPLVAAVQDKG